jgi:arginyl-tRNA synthetase
VARVVGIPRGTVRAYRPPPLPPCPFLRPQYAHARLSSILRKARDTLGAGAVDAVLADTDPAGIVFGHASDLGLALAAARFQEVLTDVQADLLPHRLCEFLFGLAGATSDFHRDCYVLHEATPPPLRASRLRLVAAAAAVMRTALRLLGIAALDRI